MNSGSTTVIGRILSANAALSVNELDEALVADGVHIERKELVETLRGHPDMFQRDDLDWTKWCLVPGAVTPGDEAVGVGKASRSRSGRLAGDQPLYAWQAEALAAWQANGRRGVVEAVTGTGKTMLGMAAASEVLHAGGSVLVLVPGVELMHQWLQLARARFGAEFSVGALGDSNRADWRSHRVIVGIVHSVARDENRHAMGSPRARSVLIADECHRYGADFFAGALDERISFRLGLTATYARRDTGNADYLDPYFGGVCYRMGYRRAALDEVVAHFKVALVAVDLPSGDRHAYDRARDQAFEARDWLVFNDLVAREPFGAFMKDVADLAEVRDAYGSPQARRYLANFNESRRILAETVTKRRRLVELAPAFKAADRSLVFTRTIDATEDGAAVLRKQHVEARALHSELGRTDREALFRAFAAGGVRAVVAAEILNEGVDVPEADLAVILAASSSRRQMVQRMGRVLRRKADGRLARFVVFYASDTTEDIGRGAHGDFLEEILDVAAEVRNFGVRSDADTICGYLNDWDPDGDVLPPRFEGDPPRQARSAVTVEIVDEPDPPPPPALVAELLAHYEACHGPERLARFRDDLVVVIGRLEPRKKKRFMSVVTEVWDPREIDHRVRVAR